MTKRKWTEEEMQQIKGFGLPIKKTQRELELEQQVKELEHRVTGAELREVEAWKLYRLVNKHHSESLQQVNTLTEALETASNFIDAIMGFYGQNLQVYGWHLNGDAEPFDNFVDDNISCDELDKIRLTLQSIKESPREEQTP